MAIVFLLNLSYPTAATDEVAAALALAAATHVTFRGEDLELTTFHQDITSRGRSYTEVSVHPVGVGVGSLDMRGATKQDFKELGDQLFAIVRRLSGFDVCFVGWDQEWLVDVEDLKSDWLADSSIYDLDGLVLREAIACDWGLDERFVPFVDGYRWVPYLGSEPL